MNTCAQLATLRLQTLYASAPYPHVSLSLSVKETSYFRENPIKTFPQQRTPVHS